MLPGDMEDVPCPLFGPETTNPAEAGLRVIDPGDQACLRRRAAARAAIEPSPGRCVVRIALSPTTCIGPIEGPCKGIMLASQWLASNAGALRGAGGRLRMMGAGFEASNQQGSATTCTPVLRRAPFGG